LGKRGRKDNAKAQYQFKRLGICFTSIKATGLNVIVECEAPSINTFTIGPIKKVLKNAVQILYFDAAGFSDSKPTSIKYNDITKVMFDDRYSNIFSKYIRYRKNK
jgi:hypothetical protein